MTHTPSIPNDDFAEDAQHPYPAKESQTPDEQDLTWIVGIAPEITAAAVAGELVESAGGRLLYVYRNVCNGFAFDGSTRAAAVIAQNESVVRVRQARRKRTASLAERHSAP